MAGKVALTKAFENGLDKFAVIESKEAIIQLSKELAIEDSGNKKVKYFDNELEAKKRFGF